MSGALFWLSDEAWAAIEPHLPRNQPGARRTDDRRIISGIIHMLRCGGRWQDVPAAYGPPTTVYNRWHRWSGRGIWRKLPEALAGQSAVADLGYLESTYVKAHRAAQGGKGGAGAGDRRLSRRTDDQDPRRLRPPRPTRRPRSHPRQPVGYPRRRGVDRRSPPLPKARRGSWLRLRSLSSVASGSGNQTHHSRARPSQAQNQARQAAISRPMAHRGRVLPPERLSPRRHAL